jgi:hypothetical protein
MTNGNCSGSSGQIEMGLGDGSDITPAPGWTDESIRKFLEIWRAWHLNDMRAGCIHQRTAWKPSEEFILVTWRLTSDAILQQRNVKNEVDGLVREHGRVQQLAPWTHMMYKAPFQITLPEGVQPDNAELYREHNRETKTAGWMRPEEHPKGILGKPCPECGYKYGTTWLKEDVPQDVIDWLFALPDADHQPAWV